MKMTASSLSAMTVSRCDTQRKSCAVDLSLAPIMAVGVPRSAARSLLATLQPLGGYGLRHRGHPGHRPERLRTTEAPRGHLRPQQDTSAQRGRCGWPRERQPSNTRSASTVSLSRSARTPRTWPTESGARHQRLWRARRLLSWPSRQRNPGVADIAMVAEGRAHDQPNSIQIDVVSRRAAVEPGSAKYVERWPTSRPTPPKAPPPGAEAGSTGDPHEYKHCRLHSTLGMIPPCSSRESTMLPSNRA